MYNTLMKKTVLCGFYVLIIALFCKIHNLYSLINTRLQAVNHSQPTDFEKYGNAL